METQTTKKTALNLPARAWSAYVAWGMGLPDLPSYLLVAALPAMIVVALAMAAFGCFLHLVG